jgi:hypothetical protein
MHARSTYTVFKALVAAYILIASPAYIGPAALGEYSAALVSPVMLSLYVFHRLGVPGLLEDDGLCWSWCGPSAFGVLFLLVFWLGAAWLAAWALSRVLARRQR